MEVLKAESEGGAWTQYNVMQRGGGWIRAEAKKKKKTDTEEKGEGLMATPA